jgi:glutathione synthase/RimK-type ligase-like ATP-grasp enzyme
VKGSTGRWSVYKLLNASEKMKPYLLSTVLFNEHSFDKNSPPLLFMIRPCFGSKKISVTSIDKEEQYTIHNGIFSTDLNGITEVTHYLNDACKAGRFYILQDLSFLHNKNKALYNLYVTVQRKIDNKWTVADIFEKSGLLNHDELSLVQKQYHDIFIETARCLESSFPECTTLVLDIGMLQEKLWIQDVELHFPKSKWSQYQILKTKKEISPFLPNTQLATPITILDFIEKYKQVMLKPCIGQWGLGVIQVSLVKGEIFELHIERNLHIIEGRKELISYLLEYFLPKKTYMVQERIQLATIDDCVFDTRVMVQREDPTSEWEVTANAVKVASKKFIVTNVARALLPLEVALEKSSIKNTSSQSINTKLDEICMDAANHLGEHFKDITIIGMDVGIDEQGEIKIIETNFVPDISLFKKLSDRSIFEKIKTKIKKRDNK